MLRRVCELAERSHDVRLCFPVLGFQLFSEVLIELGRTCAVKEHEDFEFLFHVIFVCLSFRAWVAHASRVLVSASRRNELFLKCRRANELSSSNESSRRPDAFA